MNCTLSPSTVATLDRYDTYPVMSAVEDRYATAPMIALKPAYELFNEEELHTSFEEAISDRLLAMHGKLSRLSNPTLATQQPGPQIDPMHSTGSPTSRSDEAAMKRKKDFSLPSQAGRGWQRYLTLGSLVIMFTLLGFDIMGLLVLHLH
jgi:hypothetical protein